MIYRRHGLIKSHKDFYLMSFHSLANICHVQLNFGSTYMPLHISPTKPLEQGNRQDFIFSEKGLVEELL